MMEYFMAGLAAVLFFKILGLFVLAFLTFIFPNFMNDLYRGFSGAGKFFAKKQPDISFLGAMQKLSLKQSDVLVIYSEDQLSTGQIELMKESIQLVLPLNQVIVMCGNLKLGVLANES